MINHQNGIYLDDPRYEPFWEVVQNCLGGRASQAVQRQRCETLATIAVIHALKPRQPLQHDSKLTL
jgi:hypothetical protein